MRRFSVPLLVVVALVATVTGGVLVAWPLVSDDSAAAWEAGTSNPSESPSAVDPEEVARQERQQREAKLTAALKEYAVQANDFAVAVVDNKSGQHFAYYGDQKFETASIVKVDILAALLLRAQGKDRKLTANELALATQMIQVSDNASATSLYRVIGETTGLKAANKKLGLSETAPTEAWGLTKTTPDDQAKLVGELFSTDGPFNEYSRGVAADLMTSVAEDQDWGVSAASKQGEEIALKNGWLSRSTEEGRWIVNSVGRVSGDGTDVSLAVLSHGHATQQEGIDAVEKVAAMTREHLQW